MDQRKVKKNREAVAEKMRQLLLAGKPIHSQKLLEALYDWLALNKELARHQKILDDLLEEK